MIATVKQIRNFVRSTGVNTGGNVWGRNSWTDKRKAADAKANERYVSFKLGSAREADKLAQELQDFYKLTGVTAHVNRTTAHSDWMTHMSGGEYVRTIGVL